MPAHPAGPRHGDVIEPRTAVQRPVGPQELADLAPGVWPASAQRNGEGALQVGGMDVRDIVAEAGSPVLVYDEQHVRAAARGYADAYSSLGVDCDVYYASKAFLATTVARWIVAEGVRLDVCTAGELEIALRAGVDPALILFHGNNKSVAELDRALQAGVGRFVVDSFTEIARLGALAEQHGVVARALVRVTVGVEAHTHEFIATAHEDQKFGLALSTGEAAEAARRVHLLPHVELLGLHSHIGSQIFDPAGFEVAAHRLVKLAADLTAAGVPIGELNLGGGMGIAYLSDDDPLDVADMAAQIVACVRAECERTGMPMPRLAVEPGRAIVGSAGVTLYTVGTVKAVELDSGHRRTYVSVDGGMSDNIRTALYDADYTVTLANRASDAEPVLCRVVGKHCESGDIVVKDAWLPADLATGDLLAVAATGAYCRSMASNYNALPRPAVMAVADGRLTTVLRRETLSDMLALDPGA
jgi:diaminopimelate decarboxylase